MSIVKILIVTDNQGGFQRSTSNSHKFHIGEFVKVLSDTDWQGFDIEIVKAHRSADPSPGTPAASHPIAADLYNFRFNDASLNGFDMAFFFSIASKASDPVSSDTDRQNEAAAVARFMEAGKGYFAAGDHEDLGASINQHIPRIRSMRRWAHPGTGPHGGPVAPSGVLADRHDTLQAGSDSGTSGGSSFPYQFNDQSDDLPQTITVRSYNVLHSRWFSSSLPHPLLCSPMGRINVLPDHMHEGWCEVPSDLTRDENLPGRAGKKEYPLDSAGVQVEPEVIAEATVLAHATLNQEFAGTSFEISPATSNKSFGVIAAYDGHRASIGRAVVDATWHHFVNINVIGTSSSFAGLNPDKAKGFYNGPGDTPVPAYQKIMHYFRNLVYWLIPANRGHLIFIDQLSAAMKLNPRWEQFAGSQYFGDSLRKRWLWEIIGFAQLAEEYFKATRGNCYKFHLLPIYLYPIWKFDPRIWEELAPEIAPWHPTAQVEARKQEVLEPWKQSLMPDSRLRMNIMLGTLMMAVHDSVGVHEKVTEKHAKVVQQRFFEMLPRHLDMAAEELESGIKATKRLSADFKKLAEAASSVKLTAR